MELGLSAQSQPCALQQRLLVFACSGKGHFLKATTPERQRLKDRIRWDGCARVPLGSVATPDPDRKIAVLATLDVEKGRLIELNVLY